MRRWLALRERRGLTYRELSERTGVSQGTLGYWAWKLRQEDREAAAEEQPGFVELVAREDQAGPTSGPSTVEGIGGRIEMVLGGDRRVVVSGEVDEASLERVLRVLQRC